MNQFFVISPAVKLRVLTSFLLLNICLLQSCNEDLHDETNEAVTRFDHHNHNLEKEAEDEPLLMSLDSQAKLESRMDALAVAGPWTAPQRTLEIAATQSVPVVNAPAIEPDGSCSSNNPFECSCTHPACSPGYPGTLALKDYIVSRFSFALNYGVYCCRQNSASLSVPHLSVHAVGRAIDIGIPLENGDADNGLGDQIANWLVENAEFIGIQRVIWDKTFWNGQNGFGLLGPNSSSHIDHIHIELSVAGANQQTGFFVGGAINGQCEATCVGSQLTNSDCTSTDCAALGSVCLSGGEPRCGTPRNDPHPNSQLTSSNRLPQVSTIGSPKKVSLLNSPLRIFDTRQDQQSTQLLRSNGSRSGTLGTNGPNIFNDWSAFPDSDGLWLNFTVISGADSGFSTVYSAGNAMPDVSNINYAANDVKANSVAIMKGSEGIAFEAYTPVHAIADVAASFGNSGLKLTPVTPRRVLDTRANRPILSEAVMEVNPQLPGDAEGVIFTLTAVPKADDGFLTAFPCGQEVPNASNLNYKANNPIANTVVTKLGQGKICIYSYGSTDVLVDVTGYFSASGELSYQAVTPVRVVDTRSPNSYYTGRLGETQTIEIPLQDLAGMPSNIWAATVNLTSLDTDEQGFMTTFPCGDVVPNTSSINFVGGEVIAAAVTTPVNQEGKLCIYSFSRSNLIVDLSGVWVNDSNMRPPAPTQAGAEGQDNGEPIVEEPIEEPAGTEPEPEPNPSGECTVGETDEESCGGCDFKIRTCQDDSTWGTWSNCLDMSECQPGAIEVEGCCTGGTHRKVCNDQCRWSDWGSCFSEADQQELMCLDTHNVNSESSANASSGCQSTKTNSSTFLLLFMALLYLRVLYYRPQR